MRRPNHGSVQPLHIEHLLATAAVLHRFCPRPAPHLVNVFLPLPFSRPCPQVPGHGSSGCLSGPGPAPVGQAPCVLPMACPPPIKATVSESFMFCVHAHTPGQGRASQRHDRNMARAYSITANAVWRQRSSAMPCGKGVDSSAHIQAAAVLPGLAAYVSTRQQVC